MICPITTANAVIPGLTRNPVPAKALNALRFRIRSGMTKIKKSGFFAIISCVEVERFALRGADR